MVQVLGRQFKKKNKFIRWSIYLYFLFPLVFASSPCSIYQRNFPGHTLYHQDAWSLLCKISLKIWTRQTRIMLSWMIQKDVLYQWFSNCKAHTSYLGILFQCRLWIDRSGVGPEILHLYQAFMWWWFSWCMDHTRVSRLYAILEDISKGCVVKNFWTKWVWSYARKQGFTFKCLTTKL